MSLLAPLRRRLASWWRSLPSRVTGARIDVQAEHLTHLSTKAHFVADELLERRIRAARECMGTVEPKRLLEEQPDVPKRPPIDYEDWL